MPRQICEDFTLFSLPCFKDQHVCGTCATYIHMHMFLSKPYILIDIFLSSEKSKVGSLYQSTFRTCYLNWSSIDMLWCTCTKNTWEQAEFLSNSGVHIFEWRGLFFLMPAFTFVSYFYFWTPFITLIFSFCSNLYV